MDYLISSWKDAKKINLYRKSPCGLYPLAKIDKGINYFVLALEKLGCKTLYSCEGHFDKENYIPQLYITFSCQKSTIKYLKQMLFGIFVLEYDCANEYTLRIDFDSNKDKTKKLTYLSDQWNKMLGPIKYKDKNMKEFNVTAQVYRLHDPHKQNLLINEIFVAESSEDAVEQFKNLYWTNIEFHVVKIHSAEEISQVVS